MFDPFKMKGFFIAFYCQKIVITCHITTYNIFLTIGTPFEIRFSQINADDSR